LARIGNANTAQQMYQQNLQQAQLANMQDAMKTQVQQAQQPGQLNTANYQSQETAQPNYADAVRAQMLSQPYGDIGSDMSKYLPAVQQAGQSLQYPAVATGNSNITNNTQQFLTSLGLNPSGIGAPSSSGQPPANTQDLLNKYLVGSGQSYNANPAENSQIYQKQIMWGGNGLVGGHEQVANANANARVDAATIAAQARVTSTLQRAPTSIQGGLARAVANGDQVAVNNYLKVWQSTEGSKFNPDDAAALQAATMNAKLSAVSGGQPQQSQYQPQTVTLQQPATATQRPTGPVRITGDADYAKLASGTQFVGPDGHMRIKP